QLALKAPGHPAPVAPHRLEADDLEAIVHQSGVALLAARRAAAHLGEEEARVDLLELELEMARAVELACQRPRHLAADLVAQRLATDGGAGGIGLAGIDEERV